MDDLEKLKKAGAIAKSAKEKALEMLKPGTKLLDVAELIEGEVKKQGGGLPFPVNTSLNELAAHYVARAEDDKTVEAGDLLKVDMGVEVDGFICDTAFTYCSEKEPMIDAAEKAIWDAVKVIRPGTRVGEVSQAIESSVKESGFGVIVNLTGHGLGRYNFHSPPTIPNIATDSTHVLEEGDTIALEPFLVKTNGHVKESAPVEIYRFLQDRPVRLPEARKIIKLVQEKYKSYPFAKRWLYEWFTPVKISLALRQLESVGALESFPPLKEISGQRIVQVEHTIVVSDPPVVTSA